MQHRDAMLKDSGIGKTPSAGVMQKTLLTGPATRFVLEGTSERMPVSASAYVPAILPLLAAVLRSPNFVILVAVTNRGKSQRKGTRVIHDSRRIQ